MDSGTPRSGSMDSTGKGEPDGPGVPDRPSKSTKHEPVAFRPDDDRVVEERLRLTLHELQSPILSLRIRLEDTRDRALKKDSSLETAFSQCLEELGELDRISRRLLFLDQLSSIPPNVSPVDWTTLFATLDRQHRPLAERKTIRLEIQSSLPNDEEHTISSDTSRIRLVVSNLLDNAISYGPAGSEVRLKADAHVDGVQLQVSDSGPGLPTEFLADLFEPFRRPEHHPTEPIDPRVERQSFGLGLSLARRAAASLGGHLDFDSDTDIGTTVTLWLPRKSSNQ